MKLRKIDRLVIAGFAAPRVRAGRTGKRIHVTDAAGTVLRTVDSSEVTMGVLSKAKIEFDADLAAREARLRTAKIVVSVSPAERDLIMKWAAHLGMSGASAWMRMLAISEINKLRRRERGTR